MKPDKFQEAKGNLAQSQTLLDNIRGAKRMAQQGPATAPTVAAPPAPQPQNPAPDIAQVVKDTMEPFMKRMEEIVVKGQEEAKQVELKIEGEMKPKA